MKKILFLIFCLLTSIISVSAKELNIYFYPNGGSVSPGDFQIGSYGYLNYQDNFFATYKTGNTIKKINTISSATFFVTKSNDSLVSGKEWYFKNISDGKIYFFSQAKTYRVTDVLNLIESSGTNLVSIDLYANWNSAAKKSGIDVPSVTTGNMSFSVAKSSIVVGESVVIQSTFNSASAKEKINWSSSNSKIATVNSSGKVTGIKSGKVTITGKTSSGKKNTINISITKKKYNYAIIKMNTNGGKLDSSHGSSISVENGYVLKDKLDIIQRFVYDDSEVVSDLANYNNENCINIMKEGYRAKPGAQWNTKPDGSGKSYSQGKKYKASDFCNASKKDCIVTLYVNWEKSPVTKINVDKTNIQLEVGQSTKVIPTSDGNTTFLYSAKRADIVKVVNGTITGLNAGKTKVVVSAKTNNNIKTEITVTVTKANTTSSRVGHVYFLDVRENSDATLIESNGHYGLIDTSVTSNRKKLLQKLVKLGVKKLDFIIITHAHADHTGGYEYVMDNIPVDRVYLHVSGATTPPYQDQYTDFINIAKQRGSNICDVKKSSCQHIYLGNIPLILYNTSYSNVDKKADLTGFNLLTKERARRKYENSNSIATVANINGKRIYFAGDIGNYYGQRAESITASQVGDVEVYKAAHHGNSTFNNNQDALNSLKAEYVVMTNSKDLAKTTISRLKKSNKNYKKSYFVIDGMVTVTVKDTGKMTITQ